MTDNNEDRITKLSKRFKTHAAGRPRDNSKQRERQSLYLDANLMERVDETYKEVAHALYPKSVGKSTFLEAILEFGLENLDTIKSQLSETADVS
jgi:hypothetical protein